MNPPHKLVNGEAFTEDNFLIFNVKLCKVLVTTVNEIRDFFEKFGQISKMHALEAEQIGGSNRIDYEIQYKEAKSAARALEVRKHWLTREIIYVEAFDSFEQPDGKNIIAQLNENDYSKQNNKAPITALNDDCLEHICKFLTPLDQINFALSCRRFAEILALVSKIQYKNFDCHILEYMTPFETFVFLQIIGPQIRTFSLYMNFLARKFTTNNVLETLLGTAFNNVEKLKVIGVTSYELLKLIEKMHSLQELELIHHGFDDTFIKILEKFKSLQKLSISDDECKGIKEFHDLTGPAQYFEHICKILVNLKYLDVDVHDGLVGDKECEYISKYLINLETLKIDVRGENYCCLARLPNLKKLEIKLNRGNIEEFCACLAEHQADRLEELNLHLFKRSLEAMTSVAKLERLKVLKCHFDQSPGCINKFCNLKELEVIEFGEMFEWNEDEILQLLEKCLQLKRITLCTRYGKESSLISRSYRLLKEQRERGSRNCCVNLICRFVNDGAVPTTSENCNFSDIIKVSYESVYEDNAPYTDYDYDYDSDYNDDGDNYYYDGDDYNDYEQNDHFGWVEWEDDHILERF